MQSLRTARLLLEPLVVADAPAMFQVLSDARVHRYLDQPPPPSLDHLRQVYARLEARRPPDDENVLWLNWVIRPHGQEPIGFVQATVPSPPSAWVAYLLGSAYQGRGYATEAARAMVEHLRLVYGVSCCRATVEVENRSSIRLLERLGFQPATPRESARHKLSATELLFVREA